MNPSLDGITRWANGRRNLFYLSSCGQPDAMNVGTHELVVGQGVRKCYVASSLAGVNWAALREFCNRGEWVFFVLSYDLNRCLDTGLRGGQYDALGWPLLYFVVPERVVTVSRQGAVEMFCDDPDEWARQLEQGSGCSPRRSPTIRGGKASVSISRDDYLCKVKAIKEQIAAGSFYELNLCMETVIDEIAISDPFLLHQQLLSLSPAPFSSYVQLGSMHLLSASPERFLMKRGRTIHSQPIKGTSARSANPVEDERNRRYLVESVKERAEHVMIVDLMRNDLSRLCEPGSVVVPELCGIYGYRQVYQMVSTIIGECRNGIDFIDALQAAFPMGSMTGAPKSAVMRQIEQIEPAARGWYSGSVGYIKPSGDFDSSVVIRSLMYDERQHKAKYSVGGAITYDSDPDAEYRECLLKSLAIRNLLDEYRTAYQQLP